MQRYSSIADLEAGVSFLILKEPRFAAVHQQHGTPSLRQSANGLESLLMIVTEQFLSLAAASAIWARVKQAVQPFCEDMILALDDDALKRLGLSNAKLRTFKAAAQARIDFAALAQSPDEEVRRVLCALPGIGPWTADIYLLSVMQSSDAWPAADLALQVAAQDLLGLAVRPSPQQMQALAEAWRPHRACAARLLWSHYRGIKGLKQA